MSLYALCYPSLSDPDDAFIRAYRREHDLPYRDVVAHHFTIVFGVRDLDADDFAAHVGDVAKRQRPISFTCRYAMIGDDASDDTFYVFLVPDEGFSEISKLHDRLYRGALAPFHRLDVPYVPHIGLATMSDVQRVKELCDELNDGDLAIAGALNHITVSRYDGSRISDLETLAFEG